MTKPDVPGNELTDNHNQGQKDCADGKYNPPDITPMFFRPVTTDRQVANEFARKEAYDKGHVEAKKNK